MKDWEFDLLDELYFVTGYEELQKKLPEHAENLRNHLEDLIVKGWIKCFENNSDEEILDLDKFKINYNKYNYLATKAGLLAHNSR